MTAVRRLFTTLMMLLTATALFAQEAPAPRTTETVTAETDQDVNNARALRLSLDEAINTAMKQNLGVQLQNYETRISGFNLQREYGVFDFFSAADATLSNSRNATTSAIESSAGHSVAANASINQIIPTGGQYSFGFRNSRSVTQGGFTDVSPAYRSSFTFNFAQPLMRDF